MRQTSNLTEHHILHRDPQLAVKLAEQSRCTVLFVARGSPCAANQRFSRPFQTSGERGQQSVLQPPEHIFKCAALSGLRGNLTAHSIRKHPTAAANLQPRVCSESETAVLRGYIRLFSKTLCLIIWGQPASVFGARDSGFAWLYSRKLASFFEDIRQKLCLNIWGQPASVFGERDSVFAWLYSRKLASCFEEIRQKLASFFGEMLTKSSPKVHQMLTDFGRRNVDVS
jgi:hypothetical protein